MQRINPRSAVFYSWPVYARIPFTALANRLADELPEDDLYFIAMLLYFLVKTRKPTQQVHPNPTFASFEVL